MGCGLRDLRVVELLTNVEWKIDSKVDFTDQANIKPVLEAMK